MVFFVDYAATNKFNKNGSSDILLNDTHSKSDLLTNNRKVMVNSAISNSTLSNNIKKNSLKKNPLLNNSLQTDSISPKTQSGLSKGQKKLLATLPKAIQTTRKITINSMQGLLKRFFDVTQDALFYEASHCQSDELQTEIFDARRQLKLDKHRFGQQFIDAINLGFITFATTSKNTHYNDYNDGFAPIETAIDSTLATHGALLAEITTRLKPLCKVENNRQLPIHPEALAAIFYSQTAKTDFQFSVTHTLAKYYAQCFIANIEILYTKINQVLNSLGIEQARNIDEKFQCKVESSEFRVQQSIIAQPIDFKSRLIMINAANNAEHLDSLSIESINKILDSTQKKLGNGIVDFPLDEPNKILIPIQESLKIEGYFESYEYDIIKQVCTIFDGINRIHEHSKDLQKNIFKFLIPSIKIALTDPRFLGTPQHPARKFLHKMACTWPSQNEAMSEQALQPLIEKLINNISFSSENDADLFNSALEELDKIQAQTRQYLSCMHSKLMGDQWSHKALRKLAKESSDAIDNCLKRNKVKIIKIFAEQVWQPVLINTLFSYGKHSPEWRQNISLLKDLCYLTSDNNFKEGNHSNTNTNDRVEKLSKINAVFQHIHQKIINSIQKTDDTAEILNNLHIAIRNCLSNTPSIDGYQQQNGHTKTGNIAGDYSHSQPLIPKGLNEKGQRNPISLSKSIYLNDEILLNKVKQFTCGSLFDWQPDIHDPDGTIRCRLAGIVGQHQRFIFINRKGIKVMDMTVDELIAGIKNKQIKPVEASIAFDQTLEEVVTSLRRNRDDMQDHNGNRYQ